NTFQFICPGGFEAIQYGDIIVDINHKILFNQILRLFHYISSATYNAQSCQDQYVSFFTHYLSKLSLFAFLTAENRPFSYPRCPFTKQCVTAELNSIPSKGDQPHLYAIFSLVTFQLLLGSTKTKSA